MAKRVPRLSILQNMVDEASKNDGFFISSLEVGTIIEVETADITFSFKILDPLKRKVWIWGDYEYFRIAKEAYLTGSKFHPLATMIKLDWIGFDMSLEFWLDTDKGKRIFVGTSPSKKISIDGFAMYPREDTQIN